MDNYEHKIEHFSVQVDLWEVAANQCHKPSPPLNNKQNGVGVVPWIFDNI
jgi:hypothetical protein